MAQFPAAGALSDNDATVAELKAGLEATVAAAKQLPGGSARTTLTIASGAVLPISALHLVDTEAAAAADDLTNITQTNLPEGSLLVLACVDAARVVTLKHAAGGAGQMVLLGGADVALNNPANAIILQRIGTDWLERARWGAWGLSLIDGLSAANARSALGLVIGTNVPAYDSDICISDVVKSYTAQHYAAPVVLADLTAIDCNLHALATYTLAANGTLPAASNQAAGKIIEIIITGASTYTLSANANWKMADGTAVVFTPAAGKRTHIIAESDGTYMLIHRIVQEA